MIQFDELVQPPPTRKGLAESSKTDKTDKICSRMGGNVSDKSPVYGIYGCLVQSFGAWMNGCQTLVTWQIPLRRGLQWIQYPIYTCDLGVNHVVCVHPFLGGRIFFH